MHSSQVALLILALVSIFAAACLVDAYLKQQNGKSLTNSRSSLYLSVGIVSMITTILTLGTVGFLATHGEEEIKSMRDKFESGVRGTADAIVSGIDSGRERMEEGLRNVGSRIQKASEAWNRRPSEQTDQERMGVSSPARN